MRGWSSGPPRPTTPRPLRDSRHRRPRRPRRRRHVPAAVQAVIAVDVPILGINLGRLGSCPRRRPTSWRRCSRSSSRRVRAAATDGAGGRDPARWPARGPDFTALNDFVIARGSFARVVRLSVSIDESHLATFVADGLVVSSPSGSTGYSFSAGGPILDRPANGNVVASTGSVSCPGRCKPGPGR